MKIRRLKLVNFIGINHGLGTDEVEIDFTKGSNNIVMLLGENGSGKSTIMSQLHPYKDSFDSRKSLILDGKDGRKEIDYQVGDTLYEIVHIYSKTAQSFIKKDGVELNENGGVRTFEDIVTKELGITKEFFNIGKIGSNTRNFIDFSTAERKKYIGTFLNLDEYIDSYKVVYEKFKTLKKEITSISNDLAAFGDKKIKESEKEALEAKLTEVSDQLTHLYKEQGTIESELRSIQEKMRDTKFSNLTAKKSTLMQSIASAKTVIDKYNIKDVTVEKIDKMILSVDETLKDLDRKLTTAKTELISLQGTQTDLKNKLASTNLELSALGKPEDIQRLESNIRELENANKQISEKIQNNNLYHIVESLSANHFSVQMMINKFVSFMDFIEKYFTELSAKSFISGRTNLESFIETDFNESLNREKDSIRTIHEGKQQLLKIQEREKQIEEGNVEKLSILEQRPAECHIDSCPFICDAYSHRDACVKVKQKKIQIEQTVKDISEIEVRAENITLIMSLYANFVTELEKVQPRDNEFYIEFIREKSLVDWVNGSLSEFQVARQEFASKAFDADSHFTNIGENTASLTVAKNTLSVLQNSDFTLREKYNNEIQATETALNDITGKIEEKTAEVNDLVAKQTKHRLAKANMENYKTAVVNYNAFLDDAKVIDELADELSKLTEAQQKQTVAYSDCVANIKQAEGIQRSTTDALTTTKVALKQIELLTEKLNNINKQFEPTEAVSNALSPTIGIPLILIKTYLDETEDIANELLTVAFGEDFKIKFVTTDNDFLIQVEAKGNTKQDIKMASQGEIAVTTISISLALIEQSIGDYNVLCLDEIDGPLDAKNRRNFLDILTKQMTKLGIEQVFIISHNDAFDSAATDLVLLRGNNFDKNMMDNKTIIYEV